jgi:hypothetical protein
MALHPQNREPAWSPLRAVREAIGLPQSGQAGDASRLGSASAFGLPVVWCFRRSSIRAAANRSL